MSMRDLLRGVRGARPPVGDELEIEHGPDPHISGDPESVRVRLTRAKTDHSDAILVTVEGSWRWDLGRKEVSLPLSPPPEPKPEAAPRKRTSPRGRGRSRAPTPKKASEPKDPDRTCPACGKEFEFPSYLERHYNLNPDHRRSPAGGHPRSSARAAEESSE
jgi:hypothetical protein